MQYQAQPRFINSNFAIVESQLLGKGSTGNVYLGFERSQSNHRVAIKVINLIQIDNQVTRYLLNCEVAALNSLGKKQNTAHENIVRLFDIVLQDNYIYLVTQLLEGGTLANYIKKHPNGLSEDQALYIFRQIVEGYRHMRLKNVVHRDLKPDNILFKVNPQISKRVAIIDFGYCEMAEIPNKPQIYYNVGSPKYMSPQAYQDNRYSEKSDVWALGVILYELLIGKTCDVGMSMENYLQILKTSGIPLPQHLSAFTKHLLSLILTYSQDKRCDCHQILRELDLHQNSPHSMLNIPIGSINNEHDNEKVVKTDRNHQSQSQKPYQVLFTPPPKSQVVFNSMIKMPNRISQNQPTTPFNKPNLLTGGAIKNGENIFTQKKHVRSMALLNEVHSIQLQKDGYELVLGHIQNVNFSSLKQGGNKRLSLQINCDHPVNVQNASPQQRQNAAQSPQLNIIPLNQRQSVSFQHQKQQQSQQQPLQANSPPPHQQQQQLQNSPVQHQKQPLQNLFHQSQQRLFAPPPSSQQSSFSQSNKMLVNYRILGSNQLSASKPGPQTPSRQSINLNNRVNTLANNPNYFLRSTMPPPNQNILNMESSTKYSITDSQTNQNARQLLIRNNLNRSFPTNQNISSEKLPNPVRQIQFVSQKKMSTSQFKDRLVLKSPFQSRFQNQAKHGKYQQIPKLMSLPNMPQARFRHGYVS